MKTMTEVFLDFFANLDRCGMECPVAILLTPKAYNRAKAEAHLVGRVPQFELVSSHGRVLIQAGVIERREESRYDD